MWLLFLACKLPVDALRPKSILFCKPVELLRAYFNCPEAPHEFWLLKMAPMPVVQYAETLFYDGILPVEDPPIPDCPPRVRC